MVGGVCGGLGAATSIPSWMWRAAFLFCLLAFGFGLVLYLVLWICMPGD
jgi:phage shock protein C